MVWAVPLHTPALSISTLFALGAVAGLIATAVSNIPMRLLPEGTTPPFVATGALTDTDPAAVDPTLASGLHYAAGALAGVFYTAVELFVEGSHTAQLFVTGTQLPLIPHLLAILVTYIFLVGFFAYGVLPRFAGPVAPRIRQIRRDWTLTAAVYVLALGVAIPLLLVAVTR